MLLTTTSTARRMREMLPRQLVQQPGAVPDYSGCQKMMNDGDDGGGVLTQMLTVACNNHTVAYTTTYTSSATAKKHHAGKWH